MTFTRDLTTAELRILNGILNEDPGDHPEWGVKDRFYIDLEIAPDFSGVKWNGAEKTYYMDQAVNLVIRLMREIVPDFGLTGVLHAQGEDIEDRWDLVIGEDGWAHRVDTPLPGIKVRCPYCHRQFFHDMSDEEKEADD